MLRYLLPPGSRHTTTCWAEERPVDTETNAKKILVKPSRYHMVLRSDAAKAAKAVQWSKPLVTSVKHITPPAKDEHWPPVLVQSLRRKFKHLRGSTLKAGSGYERQLVERLGDENISFVNETMYDCTWSLDKDTNRFFEIKKARSNVWFNMMTLSKMWQEGRSDVLFVLIKIRKKTHEVIEIDFVRAPDLFDLLNVPRFPRELLADIMPERGTFCAQQSLGWSDIRGIACQRLIWW